MRVRRKLREHRQKVTDRPPVLELLDYDARVPCVVWCMYVVQHGKRVRIGNGTFSTDRCHSAVEAMQRAGFKVIKPPYMEGFPSVKSR